MKQGKSIAVAILLLAVLAAVFQLEESGSNLRPADAADLNNREFWTLIGELSARQDGRSAGYLPRPATCAAITASSNDRVEVQARTVLPNDGLVQETDHRQQCFESLDDLRVEGGARGHRRLKLPGGKELLVP